MPIYSDLLRRVYSNSYINELRDRAPLLWGARSIDELLEATAQPRVFVNANNANTNIRGVAYTASIIDEPKTTPALIEDLFAEEPTCHPPPATTMLKHQELFDSTPQTEVSPFYGVTRTSGSTMNQPWTYSSSAPTGSELESLFLTEISSTAQPSPRTDRRRLREFEDTVTWSTNVPLAGNTWIGWDPGVVA